MLRFNHKAKAAETSMSFFNAINTDQLFVLCDDMLRQWKISVGWIKAVELSAWTVL